MSKLKKALRSRTFWTIAAMFVVNGLQGIEPMIGGTAQVVVNAVLSLLATHFKLNPSQDYSK